MNGQRLSLSRQCVALPLLLLVAHMLLLSSATSAFSYRRLSSDVAEQPTATTVKEVYSGLDFVQGIMDASVRTMVIMTDVVFQDSDWTGLPTPLLVDRNVTLAGDPSGLPNPRVINMNWVTGKLRLGDRVVFRLYQLVILNYRLGNHNQAPGLDIFVPCLRGASAVVETVDVVGVHRVCYPPKVQEESLAQLWRPPSIPGSQVYHVYVSQPDCVNTTSAPPLERCWPHRGMYDDVAMPGAELSDFNQRVLLTGYSVHMIRTLYLCDLLLSDSCVQNLTALGCATLTYASLNPPWQQQQQQQQLTRRPPPEAVSVALGQPTSQQSQQQQQQQQLVSELTQNAALAAPAADGSSSMSTGQKAGLAAGVAGGLVLMSLVAVVAFLIWRRKRRRASAPGEGPAGSPSQRQQQQQMGAVPPASWARAASWAARPRLAAPDARGEGGPADTAIGIPPPFTTTPSSSTATHSHSGAGRLPAAAPFDAADTAGKKGAYSTAAAGGGGMGKTLEAAGAAATTTAAADRRSDSSSQWRPPPHSAATTGGGGGGGGFGADSWVEGQRAVGHSNNSNNTIRAAGGTS